MNKKEQILFIRESRKHSKKKRKQLRKKLNIDGIDIVSDVHEFEINYSNEKKKKKEKLMKCSIRKRKKKNNKN